MNLSRCNWLRLLVVGAGTATAGNVEYELGPGGKIVLLAERKCPKENVDLVFKNTRKEVDELISNIKVIEPFRSEKYSLAWGRSQKFTAMHYDLETNLATFFASDVVRYIPLNLFVTETGGAYTLTDPTAMNMLQFFPGLTVCIDDPDIIAKFKEAHPDKVAWAERFKYIVTEYGISFNLETDYLRVEVEKGAKMDMSELKVVDGNRVVIRDGCLGSKEDIESVVNTLLQKRVDASKKEILFDKGCVKLALARKSFSITKDLADDEEMTKLEAHPDKTPWAERFKYVLTAYGPFTLEVDYLRVEVEKGAKMDMSELKVVDGNRVVIRDGCLETEVEVEQVVAALLIKRVQAGKQQILFGKGCVKLAFAYHTISIDRNLANELKSLGDIAVWAKPYSAAYIAMATQHSDLEQKKKQYIQEIKKLKDEAETKRAEIAETGII
eukprot:GHVS01059924.1.p1 GENE.GHVS01059924.1~~GHVS01059924.1.p1  ORF type:complete len:440 (-),score=42.25 GHVS01059924.1:694-2013(-)